MEKLGKVDTGKYSLNGIALDPSSEIGFFASDDCNIKVIDLKNFSFVSDLKGHEDAVLDLAFDPFNKQIISCSSDKTFRTWG